MTMWDVLGPERNLDGSPILGTGERAAKCEKVRIGVPGIPVQAHRSKSGAWSHSGLSICHNAHVCAPCAYRKARELAGVFSACMAKWASAEDALSPDVWLLTLTLPHDAQTPWKSVVGRLVAAWRLLVRSTEFARFRKRWGIVGTPRVWDETVGRNGLHGHWHVALFTSHAVWRTDDGMTPMRALEQDVRDLVFAELERELQGAWERAGRAVGAVKESNVGAFREVGLDLRAGDESAAYLVKWGMPEELALNPVKRGRTHWHLLDDYAAGARSAGDKFREYYEATQGLAVVSGLGRLRNTLGVDDDYLESHLDELQRLRLLQAEVDGEVIEEFSPLTVEIPAYQFHAALAVGWHAVHEAADLADARGDDAQEAVDALLAAYQRRKRERAPP